MKKIPTGAEASNVLVGELDFLRQPIVAFVRLTPAVLLSGMTEVPIPTRSEGEAQRFYFKKPPPNERTSRCMHQFGVPREQGQGERGHFSHSHPFPAVSFKPLGQF